MQVTPQSPHVTVTVCQFADHGRGAPEIIFGLFIYCT